MVEANRSNRFQKQDRVVTQDEFDRVYESGQFAADRVLVVKAIKNGLDRSRLGLSVSRRVGNAVVRNRWKRTVREAFRLSRMEIPIGMDLVVRPRKGAVLNFHSVKRSLVSLSRRLHRNLEGQQR